MSKAYPDLNDELVLKKLLCHGLFPQFLEPIFSSELFGELVIANDANPVFNIYKESFHLLPYKITRNNNAPRYMGIPHPLAHINLSRVIKANWGKIDNSIAWGNKDYRSTSMIIPRDNDKRVVALNSDYDGFLESRLVLNAQTKRDKRTSSNLLLKKQFGAKYLVFADISGCFSNIYSHSIPWALVGKDHAKAHRAKGEWFNEIDSATRKIKNDETNGLPIGPDTSHILSEIVLSKIDKVLINKGYKYLRFIDDYHCYCKSKEDSDAFIKDLSNELEKYQLKLNSSKTKIIGLPQSNNNKWVRELRNFVLPEFISSSIDNDKDLERIEDFLDLSVDLSVKNGDYAPFKYAIKIIKNKKFEFYYDYKKFFSYISNVAVLHPYIIDIFDDLISYALNEFEDDDIEDFKEYISNFIKEILVDHIPCGRSDVIVWSLFLATKYKIKIDGFELISDKIIETHDPLPVLMCFIYSKNNHLNLDKFYNLLAYIDQCEWWLYVYELLAIDESRVRTKIVNLEYDSFYTFLKNSSISFLNSK